MNVTINRIISGGQTGADQAALDCAMALKLEYGGWLPPGRMTERGSLASKYIMQVMARGGYPQRTRKNVEEADGTLIVSHGPLTGGSALTAKLARQQGKSCLHIDLDHLPVAEHVKEIQNWLNTNDILTLNVAGPRASSDPRIYENTLLLLMNVFSEKKV